MHPSDGHMQPKKRAAYAAIRCGDKNCDADADANEAGSGSGSGNRVANKMP